MSKLKIAVAGAGLIGRKHIEIIAASERADICAIADPMAHEFARAGDLPCYDDLDQLLASENPDGVILATPNHLHLAGGLSAIKAGIPALVEKPIADSAAHAEQLVSAAKDAGVHLLVGHHRRHNPIIKEAKAQVASGRIGDVVMVQGSFWIYKHDAYFDEKWRTEPGAGPIYINLIHDVDLMRHLVGEVVEVQAFTANAVRGFAVEDTAAILMRFENGALGTFSVSDTIVSPWSWELSSAENAAYPAMGQNCYHVGGTHGSLEIPRGRVWTQKDRHWWNPMDVDTYAVDEADPLVLQLAHFCDVIAGRVEPIVSGEEGLKSLRVVEAVVKAAETGKMVQV